jgi:hypothetical protein
MDDFKIGLGFKLFIIQMCVPLSKGMCVGNLQIAMGLNKIKTHKHMKVSVLEINDFKVYLRF